MLTVGQLSIFLVSVSLGVSLVCDENNYLKYGTDDHPTYRKCSLDKCPDYSGVVRAGLESPVPLCFVYWRLKITNETMCQERGLVARGKNNELLSNQFEFSDRSVAHHGTVFAEKSSVDKIMLPPFNGTWCSVSRFKTICFCSTDNCNTLDKLQEVFTRSIAAPRLENVTNQVAFASLLLTNSTETYDQEVHPHMADKILICLKSRHTVILNHLEDHVSTTTETDMAGLLSYYVPVALIAAIWM